MPKLANSIARAASLTGATLKSIVKMMLLSRRATLKAAPRGGRPLIIMGNGPSLADVIARTPERLRDADTMAVNFAANAPEYEMLRPKYYLMVDPHFEAGRESSDPNVGRLFERIDALTSREMTLIIPAGWDEGRLGLKNPLVSIARINAVGLDGWTPLIYKAFDACLGMPSPRNVLVPAIMAGIRLGYKEIYLTGADHSWTRTLSVTDANEVVSIQPHFYEDNSDETERVTAVYRNVRLHEVMLSFHLAFKSYHALKEYAASRGVSIFNSTPGSFIDAFERRPLPEPDTLT